MQLNDERDLDCIHSNIYLELSLWVETLLTWFIRYIYLFFILQFLNNVIIINAKVLPSQAWVTLSNFGQHVFWIPKLFLHYNLLIMTVPDEGYSRHAPCPLHLIYTFSIILLGRCLSWWTISPRGYHPPSSQCFGIGMISIF